MFEPEILADGVEREIRDIIVRYPTSSPSEISNKLAEKGLKDSSGNKISQEKSANLVLNITRRLKEKIGGQKASKRMLEIKESYRYLNNILMDIAEYAEPKDQIQAIKTSMSLELQIYQAEIDSGLIKVKKQGKKTPDNHQINFNIKDFLVDFSKGAKPETKEIIIRQDEKREKNKKNKEKKNIEMATSLESPPSSLSENAVKHLPSDSV